jgi:hypothetical protein
LGPKGVRDCCSQKCGKVQNSLLSTIYEVMRRYFLSNIY